MKGLFLKDLFLLRKYMIAFAILFVILAFLEPGAILLISFFFLLIFGIVTFSLDETAGWDRYAHILPVTHTQIIAEKYLLILGCTMLLSVLNLIYYYIIFSFPTPLEDKEILTQLIMQVIEPLHLIGLVMLATFYPLAIRFGISTARIILIGAALIPLSIGFLQEKHILPEFYIFDTIEVDPLSFSLAALGIFGISFLLSVWIYKRKEV